MFKQFKYITYFFNMLKLAFANLLSEPTI